jgi:DNA-binding NarL/FixJ family response regulator
VEKGMALRILIADDHHLVRQGLEALLERAGFQVVGGASDGLEAVRLARTLDPDVAVIDLGMPTMNGIAAAAEIRRESPRTRTILLTMHTDDAAVLEALRAGVRGYVGKAQVVDDLVVAIREVVRGSIYLSPAISACVVRAWLGKEETAADALSRRETEILQLLAEGKSAKETAGLLGISTKTVESHRHRIRHKLDIRDTAGLIRHAIRRKLVEP